MLAGSLFVLPQYLRRIQDYDATQTSLFFCVDAIATYAGFLFGTRFTRKSPTVVVLMALAVFAAANHLLTLTLTPDTPALDLYLILVLHGAALGMMVPSVSGLLLATSVPRYFAFDMAIYLVFRGLGVRRAGERDRCQRHVCSPGHPRDLPLQPAAGCRQPSESRRRRSAGAARTGPPGQGPVPGRGAARLLPDLPGTRGRADGRPR